jgi:uncharacterized protein (DUF2252 family)
MIAVDPMALARRQLACDRARTERFPSLFPRKVGRMTASPLAFLRGAAPLFYDLLAAHPSLADGPRGKGWLVGDLHMENFGAFRPDPLSDKKQVEAHFNLNDFDDAVVGPFRLDVLRLTTSLLLAGRELGCDGTRALALCHRLVDAYAESAFDGAKLPREPDCVAALVAQVASRTRRELLDARTSIERGERRFIRGERYLDLPKKLAKQVEGAFAAYAAHLPPEDRPSDEQLEVLDYALRIAGTGSLGSLRVAVLVRGKGGVDGAWIFDLKEQGIPSASALLGRPPKRLRMEPALRVITAFRACVATPARLIGTTTLDGLSMFARKLTPQEDKLDLGRLRASDLDPLASYLGALTGAAHARGAAKLPRKGWSRADRDVLIDRAIAVAGVHEAVYLALCKLARDERLLPA